MTAARILFVDDNPHVLSGLRRTMHSCHEPWETAFVTSGEEALAELAARPADVVVTDMRMPGMDGATLLEHVRTRYPRTARLVLSGHAGLDAVVAAAGPTQLYLAKPCAAETLMAALRQVLTGRDVTDDGHWRDLVGGLTALPKPPTVYTQLVALTRQPDTSVKDVVRVVQGDIGLTTEMLKLVNSAFFALPSPVDGVERAVTLLGFDVIQALALAGTVFRSTVDLPPGFDAHELGRRALSTSLSCRRIALAEGWEPATVTALTLAGLLQDAGLLVLAAVDPGGYERYVHLRTIIARPAAERQAFGVTTGRVAAQLLTLWGFSPAVIELVAEQPVSLAPDLTRPIASAAALALAFARERVADPAAQPPEDAYLDAARRARWQAATTPG